MRMIVLMLLASLTSSLSAQNKDELTWPSLNLDPSTNLISYSEVPKVPEATSADLYDRAMSWAQKYYKNLAEKLRKNDRKAGEIAILGRFPIFAHDKKGVITPSRQGLIQYTLTLRFRDGRYKYEITKLNMKDMSYIPLEPWLDRNDHEARNHSMYLTDIDNELKGLISEMKSAIAKAPEPPNDDW